MFTLPFFVPLFIILAVIYLPKLLFDIIIKWLEDKNDDKK